MATVLYPWQIIVAATAGWSDPIDGFLTEKEFLILDRDSKFSSAFRGLLRNADIEVVRLPPRSPNLNAYAERVR